MAEGSDDVSPLEFDEGGGAIKTFLEHLEDLRWVLIKSAAAILIGMLLCLFNTNRLMGFLQWPLDRAQGRHIFFLPDSTNQMVTFQFGSLRLPPVNLGTNHVGALDFGTNQHITIQSDPVQVEGQLVWGLRVITNLTGTNAAEAKDNTGPKLVFMDPSEPFMFSIHIAFYAGLILASPWVLYYIGQFLMPALKIKEKKYFVRSFAIGVALFFTGVSFAYFILMPPALKFAQQYSEWMGVETPLWQVQPYMSFVVKFMLGMGLGFELPVVLLALVKVGILDYEKLASMRRYMIVVNLILGAILTTNEVITQIAMFVALQVLYEVAVFVAWYWERQEKKAQKG
jgi:sec-independent protein translocase protein TatC